MVTEPITEDHADLAFNLASRGGSFALWKGWNADQRLRTYLGRVARRHARWPHHTASADALLGRARLSPDGELLTVGSGELLLAGTGVLVLQDLPEFRREAVERLATAWRAGRVRLQVTAAGGAGADLVVDLPVRCHVWATAEACPCGFADRPRVAKACCCSPEMLRRWRDRVDQAVARFKGVEVIR